jgi:hypothetical protein
VAAKRTVVRAQVSTRDVLVVAHTLGEPNPSTSVLTRCGFARVAALTDDELGSEV